MSKLSVAYSDYASHATADTLNALFRAITDTTRRIVRSKKVANGTAEDIAQEATLAAYTRLTQFDPKRSNIDAWVFRITLDKLTDHVRRTAAEKRKPEVPFPTEEGREIDPDHYTPPAEARSITPAFMKELRDAAGKHAELMELVIALGSVERAAEALGITVRAAQQRLRSIAPNFLSRTERIGST